MSGSGKAEADMSTSSYVSACADMPSSNATGDDIRARVITNSATRNDVADDPNTSNGHRRLANTNNNRFLMMYFSLKHMTRPR